MQHLLTQLTVCPLQGPYITEAGTPVADMWEAEFGHLDKKKVGRGAVGVACVSAPAGAAGVLLKCGLAPDLLGPLWQSAQHRSVQNSPPTVHPSDTPPPQHMMDMLTLTTRMNALARVTLGNVNIAATTALQVRTHCACLGSRAPLQGRLRRPTW